MDWIQLVLPTEGMQPLFLPTVIVSQKMMTCRRSTGTG